MVLLTSRGAAGRESLGAARSRAPGDTYRGPPPASGHLEEVAYCNVFNNLIIHIQIFAPPSLQKHPEQQREVTNRHRPAAGLQDEDFTTAGGLGKFVLKS